MSPGADRPEHGSPRGAARRGGSGPARAAADASTARRESGPDPVVRPLNSHRDFDAWPPLDPGRFLDMNPSLVETALGERWVLFCRYPVPPRPGLGSIWAVRVDGDLRPAGRPVLLIGDGIDPRIVACGERLFLFYASLERDAGGIIDGSCMVAAEFAVAGERWDCRAAYQLPKFPLGGQRSAEAQDKWEKNWVPFVVDSDTIGLIYAHEPWDVITLDVRAGTPPRLSESHRAAGLVWDYGTIRGGTPPVRYDAGRLVTFFHAAQVIGSRRVYTVGACVFRDTAPFTPELMTPEPLLVAPYATGAHRFGWAFAGSVVFPAGAVASADGFGLISGRDDGEIATFDVLRSDLDRRLTPAVAADSVAFRGSRDGPTLSLPLVGLVGLPDGIAVPDDAPLINFARILIGRGRTFVDIGTWGGAFSMALAPRFDRVVAFEPDALLRDWFERNRVLNGYAHVSCTRGSPGTGEVAALDAQGLADVDLIRFEAQGHDLSPLAGALDLLAACRPLVLCRITGDPALRSALETLMSRVGYSVEPLFPLSPAWVLCRSEASRHGLAWFV